MTKEIDNIIFCPVCIAKSHTVGYDRAELEQLYRFGEADFKKIAQILKTSEHVVENHFKNHLPGRSKKEEELIDKAGVLNRIARTMEMKVDSLFEGELSLDKVKILSTLLKELRDYMKELYNVNTDLNSSQTIKLNKLRQQLDILQDIIINSDFCPRCREIIDNKLFNIEGEDVLKVPHEMTESEILAKLRPNIKSKTD